MVLRLVRLLEPGVFVILALYDEPERRWEVIDVRRNAGLVELTLLSAENRIKAGACLLPDDLVKIAL